MTIRLHRTEVSEVLGNTAAPDESQDSAPPVVEPPPRPLANGLPVLDEYEARELAERQFEADKTRLEQAYADYGLQLDEIKEQQKVIKGLQKEVMDELRSLVHRGPQVHLAHQFDPNNPDAWRSVPLSGLGLRSHLEERLVDYGVETIGQLETLRANVHSKQAKWPKWFGESKVEEVTNVLLDWLAKNAYQNEPEATS